MNIDIPMPTESEKQAAITQIVEKGYKNRKTMFTLFIEMKETFGLRTLFFGVGDCIYLAVIIMFIVYVFLFAVGKTVLFTCIFTASPLLYLTAWLLTVRKEYYSQTLELQNVCKYTPVHITALRMLLFSLLSMVADIPVAAVSSYYMKGTFWNLLLLSFCSLFLYAVLQLLSLLIIPARIAAVVLPFAWTVICLLPVAITEIQWEMILQSIRLPVLLAFLPILIAIYWFLLNFYIRKGNAYAQRA